MQSRKPDAPGESGADLNGLEQFVRDGDRNTPPHFAGRRPEIEEVEGLLASVRKGKAGLTRVITAAPGAGKTALLAELARRWKESGKARPVLLESTAFSDPAQVVRRIFLAVDMPAARRFGTVETETDGQRAEGGVSAGLLAKASRHSQRTTQRANLPATFFDAFQELDDRATPVALLVDEAQLWGTNQEDGGRWISSLLVEAHMNLRRLPLLIVAAGLGDAPESLAQRGATKLATGAATVLGPLSNAEMREVCKAFLDRYGVVGDVAQRAEWTEAIIAGTDGWPRHVTNALRGAAQAISLGEGHLARSSLTTAKQTAREFRRFYCRAETEPFQGMPELLAAVFRAMPASTGATQAALRRAINESYRELPELADQMERSNVFSTLLHQGLVQDFGNNRYDCPIPSLRNHVEAFCAADGHPVGAALGAAGH